MKILKRFLITVFLLCGTSAVQAADLGFVWDPMPTGQEWTAVRIYEIVGTQYLKVAEVSGGETTAVVKNVAPGKHVYVARTTDGTWESVDSNQVSTPKVPVPPEGFKIKVTVTVIGVQ